MLTGFVSTNREVRMPSFLNSETISVRKILFFKVSHPALEVMASWGSGTRVTWSGLTERTRVMNSWDGYPSILNSVVISGLISRTSLYLICLSSGRGWTVIPSAPKSWQFMAAFNTFGTFPPRAFLRVAILLILTLNFVIIIIVKILRIVIVVQNYNNWFFFYYFSWK